MMAAVCVESLSPIRVSRRILPDYPGVLQIHIDIVHVPRCGIQ